MEPLEALLIEEQSSINREPKGDQEAGKAALLPYVKHQPYFSLIVTEGDIYLVPDSETPDQLKPFLADRNRQLIRKSTQVVEAAGQVGDKHSVNIGSDDIRAYLVVFAKRILDYANIHLQDIVRNDADIDLQGTMEDFHPSISVAVALTRVRGFYEAKTKLRKGLEEFF